MDNKLIIVLAFILINAFGLSEKCELSFENENSQNLIRISKNDYRIGHTNTNQIPECEELIDFVLKNGKKIGSVMPLELFSSEWLNEVEYYQVEENFVVVAEFKKMGRYGYTYKKYIFCGVPKKNWDSFKVYIDDILLTYGEKFHKFIIDYKCRCE